MSEIAFNMTHEYVLAGTKTVTRRNAWENLKPGILLCGTFRGKPFAKIRVVSVRRERLEEITKEECTLEGFSGYNPSDFIRMYLQMYPTMKKSDVVTRIEFELVERIYEPTPLLDVLGVKLC